ncbi:MAG: hypothetical protein ACJ8AP_11950 [Gemmatimonadales bacterium]
MRGTVPIGLLCILALSMGIPTRAWSQWSLGLGVGADRFWGGSLENGPEQKSFRPYRPTVFSVGAERRFGRFALGLRATYTEAALGLEGEGAVVAVKDAFEVIGLAPEISYRIAALGPNRLVLHAGPLIEFWHPIDSESRTRAGARGAASLLVPLGGRFGLSVAGSLAVISSPFNSDELLEQYERQALWRRGFSGALQYLF